MKITRLIESKKLYEEDANLSEVDPSKDSISDIADGIQGAIEDATDGKATISDADANKMAADIKNSSADGAFDYVGIDPALNKEIGVHVDDWDTLGVKNDLTDMLDMAYEETIDTGKPCNVLIEGLPGSGKTSVVRDWANAHSPKLHLFEVDIADEELEKALKGLNLRDLNDTTNKNSLVKAYGRFLDKLNTENTVLYLDEFNRGSATVRRAMMTLLLDRTTPDLNRERGLRHYPNLLFTIATQNPAGVKADPTAKELSSAELDRFAYKNERSFDSKRERAHEYFTKHYDKRIAELNDKYKNDNTNPAYLAKLEELLKMRHLMRFITSDPKLVFLAGDAVDQNGEYDAEKIKAQIATLGKLIADKVEFLTQRSLTRFADGTPTAKRKMGLPTYKDGFIYKATHDNKLRKEDREMLKNILANYKEPAFDWLVANYNKEDNGQDLNAPVGTTSQVENEPVDTDIEDSADLFNNGGSSANVGNSSASAATVIGELGNILAGF